VSAATVTLPSSVLRDLLAGAVVCAARDATTPVLECVRLTWDGTDVKADSTDRYRMVEGTYGAAESTGPASVLLDRRDVERAIQFLPKAPRHGKAPDVVVGLDDRQRLTFEMDDATRGIPVAAPDREFPKIEGLWPSGEPVPTAQVGLDPGRTAGMSKVPLDGKTTPWRWTFYGEAKPVLVTAPGPGGIAWRWVIMPIRLAEAQR
jgi:hypothetical protein